MDVVADVDNDLSVEWPGINRSSLLSDVQFCLKSGSGTVEPILIAKVTECFCFQERVSLVYYWALIL